MHRSRLYGVFVDAPLAQAPQAVGFWSAALGASSAATDGDPFVALTGALPDLVFEVQAVDIETDDVEAETHRLLALGATEHVRHDGWVVLRAPGGHLLCVVPVQSDREKFDATARSW